MKGCFATLPVVVFRCISAWMWGSMCLPPQGLQQGCEVPCSQPGEQSLSPPSMEAGALWSLGRGWVCRSHCGPPSALPPLQPPAARRAQHWPTLRQPHADWSGRAMVPEKGWRVMSLG